VQGETACIWTVELAWKEFGVWELCCDGILVWCDDFVVLGGGGMLALNLGAHSGCCSVHDKKLTSFER
jgi:hypothetical protein